MEISTKVVLIFFLLFFSIQDLKHREIGFLPVVLGVMILLPLRLIGVPEEREGLTWMLKLLPGATYLLMALWKGNKVGYGDGVCMLLAGIALWPGELLCGLLGTLIPLLFVVVYQRRKGTWKKDKLIPYIPVLTAGIILGLLWDSLVI